VRCGTGLIPGKFSFTALSTSGYSLWSALCCNVVWPPPPLPKEPQPVTVECYRCKTKQVLKVQMTTVGWPFLSTGEALTVECLECKEHFYPFLPGPITAGPFKV
jgi:hypothetical protein